MKSKIKKISDKYIKIEVIKYIIACIMLGSLPIISKNLDTGPLQATFIRILVGTFFLMVIFCCSRFRATIWDYSLEQFICLLVSGTCIGLTWLILADSGSKLGTTTVTLTYSLGPGLLLIASPFLFHETDYSLAKLIGFFLCSLGVFLLDYEWIIAPNGISRIFDVLVAAVFSVVVVYCNKKLEDIDGLENAMFQMIVAFLVIFVIYVWRHDLYFTISENDSWWLIMGGVFNTGLPVYLYLSSIDELRADTIAFAGYARPLTSISLAVFFYGERIGIEAIVGAVLILGGVALANLVRREHLGKSRTF